MSIELQIQSSKLGEIAARAVQERLRTTCFAPISPLYIDHADVGSTPVEVVSAGAAVRLRVPIEIFVVSRAAVLAAPNAVPNGATTPTATVIVVLEMAATGAVVSLQGVDVELDNSQVPKGPILDAIGSPMTVDLTNLLNQLTGAPAPSSSRVERVGSVVTIRFDPAGDGAEHLFPGHEWGLFIDGPSVEDIARRKISDRLKSFFPALTTTEHWRPAGVVPHVDIDYAAKVPVPDPWSVRIDGTLGCDFSLTPTITKFLRTTVHWSLHIDAGPLVPRFYEKQAEHLAAIAFDPKMFEGKPIDGHTFSLDSMLSEASFGGAKLEHASLMASAAGMTIGGPVRFVAPAPGKDTVQLSVGTFGPPFVLRSCRELAKVGSGDPPKTVSLSELETGCGVTLTGCGALCHVENASSPVNDWVMKYVTKPSDGTPGESQNVSIGMPTGVGLSITDPLRLIIRTPRGVRLVDLGVPPPVQYDDNGNVTNAIVSWLDSCLYIPGGPLDDHGVKWGKDVVVQPPEDPAWTKYLGAQEVIDVQLVRLDGLDPGELLQFRSRDHAVDVTADRNGRATVPVLLPLANLQEVEPASLVRVNRRSIAGHLTVRTATFVRRAQLEAGRQHSLASSVNGNVVLTTEFDDHIDVHEIGQLGAPMLVNRESAGQQQPQGGLGQAEERHSPAAMGARDLTRHESHDAIRPRVELSNEEVILNPQPLPPEEVDNLLPVERITLPGITSLLAVPGFAESPIALAAMADGSKLVLDLGEEVALNPQPLPPDPDGTLRVAGTFTGPIGPLETSGDLAFAVDHDQLSIYRMIRS